MITWRKSTRSGPWTDNCVEVGMHMWKKSSGSSSLTDCVEVGAATWKKSTLSNMGDCVEVSDDGTDLLVRHSKDPDGATIRYTPSEWKAFIEGVKLGEFDI